jgi:hypothetical protein
MVNYEETVVSVSEYFKISASTKKNRENKKYQARKDNRIRLQWTQLKSICRTTAHKQTQTTTQTI